MYEDHDDVGGRGIHVLVLHQGTGALMASRSLLLTYFRFEPETFTYKVLLLKHLRFTDYFLRLL